MFSKYRFYKPNDILFAIGIYGFFNNLLKIDFLLSIHWLSYSSYLIINSKTDEEPYLNPDFCEF